MSRGQSGGRSRGFLVLCLALAVIAVPLLLLASYRYLGIVLLAVSFALWFFTGPDERFIAGQRGSRQEELKRQHTESLLHRDAVGDEINYMSGVEFERFMADVFRQQGYGVETTKASGDQGVDLLLDVDGKKVAVQLKRWTGPVGNAVVGATFAGMAYYGADEGWIITTSTFTRSARELARSTRVRLIDGKELGVWLEGLREQE